MAIKAKLKIKATGSDVSDLMGMKNEFRGHAPQKDVDLMNGDNSMGEKYMDPNPASRQKEATHKSEDSDITKTVKQTTKVNTTPDTTPMEGFDVVRQVNREVPIGMPERARRYNNQVRDARTNLGRGKPSVVVTD